MGKHSPAPHGSGYSIYSPSPPFGGGSGGIGLIGNTTEVDHQDVRLTEGAIIYGTKVGDKWHEWKIMPRANKTWLFLIEEVYRISKIYFLLTWYLGHGYLFLRSFVMFSCKF